jgi:hypothetical protein
MNIVKNALFEAVEQQSLQHERPTFVAQKTNLFSQFITVVIHVPPTMAIVAPNVLQIPLPKFHDSNDVVTHIGKLAKVCVTNGEDIDAHKL